jgi:hypothetical protein
MEALRTWGVSWPHPESYHRYERAHHNLDRWTSDDGEAAQDLEAAQASVEQARRREVLHTNDKHRAEIVAAWVHESFPAVRNLRANVELDGGFGAGCYAGIVWGLALCMFGLDEDPLPEHISGRILPGEPVRDVRAPFRDARAVYMHGEQASGASIGGGGCVWPADDTRGPRTRARWNEMYVRGTTHSASRVAGEAAVHTGLSAQLARRRVRLTPHEDAIAEAMLDRDLTKDERVLRLRELHLRAQGGAPELLATRETLRLRGLQAAMPDDKKTGEALAGRESIDAAAYASLLHEATKDVTDAALLAAGKAVRERIEAAVYRVSVEGDKLAGKPLPARGRRGGARVLADA